MHDHLHIHTSLFCITCTPYPHCPYPPQHTYGHIHTFSLSHTHKISIKKTRAHLKRPNPNKHKLELNSNIWKYGSVKNFPRKKKLSNIGGLFSHTQKGSVCWCVGLMSMPSQCWCQERRKQHGGNCTVVEDDDLFATGYRSFCCRGLLSRFRNDDTRLRRSSCVMVVLGYSRCS